MNKHQTLAPPAVEVLGLPQRLSVMTEKYNETLDKLNDVTLQFAAADAERNELKSLHSKMNESLKTCFGEDAGQVAARAVEAEAKIAVAIEALEPFATAYGDEEMTKLPEQSIRKSNRLRVYDLRNAQAAISTLRAKALLPTDHVNASTSWGDREDEMTSAIIASHPIHTGDHETYQTAMTLVGNRHSKASLVMLVNHLLKLATPASSDKAPK